MELDLREGTPLGAHRIVTSAVAPRPIGWISTRSLDGVDNLAPYSFFNVVNIDPPVLMFSAGMRDGELKDTPRNVLDSEAFAYNLVTEPLAAGMNETGASFPSGESEFDAAGIDRADAVAVDVARVADAAVCFECTLYDTMRLYDHVIVFGEVVYAHVDDDVLTDGKLDSRKISAVGRLGGPYYTRTDLMDLALDH